MSKNYQTSLTHWRAFTAPYQLGKCLSRLKSGERNGYSIELLYENAYAYHFKLRYRQRFTPCLMGKLESNTAHSTYVAVYTPNYWQAYRPHIVLSAIGSFIAIIGGFGAVDFIIWGILGAIMLYDYWGRRALLAAMAEVLQSHPAYYVPPIRRLPT